MSQPDVERSVPAPALSEVAQIWWDVERAPRVTWDAAGRRYELVDPHAPANRLHLATFAHAPDQPEAMARVLAEGLAACDFPPTERRASPGRVVATLRAAGRSERPV